MAQSFLALAFVVGVGSIKFDPIAAGFHAQADGLKGSILADIFAALYPFVQLVFLCLRDFGLLIKHAGAKSFSRLAVGNVALSHLAGAGIDLLSVGSVRARSRQHHSR